MTGLRERKKQQTRDKIVQVALRLFRRHGFENTTIAGIAEAADISPRTFFSYFETKEAVVFHDLDELVGRLESKLTGRAGDETTFDALRGWVAETIATHDVTSREEIQRRELIRKTPALAAQDRANRGRMERVVAESIAKDLGVEAGAMQPRMVAAAAVAALVALSDTTPDELPAELMAVVDEALRFLQGGLDGLKS